MTDEPFDLDADIAAAQTLLRDSAIELYLAKGMTQADAEMAADKLLNSPPHHLLPTFEELDDPAS